MTAEAVIDKMTSSSLPDPVDKAPSSPSDLVNGVAPLPDWVFPPPQGFVAEDLDHIPDLPAHTELIDGSLVFVSPQRRFHEAVIHRLYNALEALAPANHEVVSHMTVKLGPRQRPEPDLLVLGPDAPGGSHVTCFDAADVVVAVEVVSPESELRDRQRKPALYAEAGLPHYWRIEEDNDKPVIYTFELDPATKHYVGTGIHHDRLKTTYPFDIDIDLTTLHKHRTR